MEEAPLKFERGSWFADFLLLYDILRPLIRPTISPMDDLSNQSEDNLSVSCVSESSPVNAIAIQIKIANPMKNSNRATPRANLYETTRSLPI